MKSLINNVNRKLGRKSKKGFSLVELLVVIAVIGVIAAIAIPAMSNVFENSRTAKAKRNAQNIASTYAAARAAGASFASTDTTVAKIAEKLASGITGTGQFSTTKFSVALDTTEATAAAAYLTLGTDGPGGTAQNATLTYSGTDGDL